MLLLIMILVAAVAAVIGIIALGVHLLAPRSRSPVRQDPDDTASITVNVRSANSAPGRSVESEEDETI